MSYIAGKNTSVTVGEGTLFANNYTYDTNGAELDVTNFESNGFREVIIGILSGSWSISGFWNTSFGDDPPGLYPRDDGTNMVFNPGGTIPTWVCSQSGIASSASGNVTYSARGSTTGDYS